MKRLGHGFTLIEIAVVITVVAVLSSIIIVSFNITQRRSRDDTRSLNAKTIVSALESYYNDNGAYPGCVAMTASAATVASNTLVGMPASTLKTPRASETIDNSVVCSDSTIDSADIYAYLGDTTASCSTGASCKNFTLKWRDETDGTIHSISSIR